MRRKGHTCLNCRRRKIRCDGIRPRCGQCTSGSTAFEDCEYPDESPTPSQLLEQQISQVKGRIQELEDPRAAPTLTLRHPYASGDPAPSSSRHSHAPSADSSSNNTIGTNIPHAWLTSQRLNFTGLGLGSSPSRHSPAADPLVVEAFREPPVNRRQETLHRFFNGALQFGFFLDRDRFYHSIMLPNPIGDPSRPAPALLHAVYLWASHVSSSSTQFEKMMTRNALHHLSRDLSGSHPHKVLHSIQAEVLLSFYYLKNGRMLEGTHHADAALSLALAANLHRIRSPTASNSTLPPPADAIEEAERIDAFWNVLILSNYWSVMQESQSSSFLLQNGAVDTPWPMVSLQHEYHLLPVHSRATVQDFLEGRSSTGFSDKALHAKATILFERASSIHAGDGADSTTELVTFTHLDSLITAFQSSLPVVDAAEGPGSTQDRWSVTHMLAHATMIKLHLPLARQLDDSYRKTIYAAQAIAGLTSRFGTGPDQLDVDPIVGVVWAAAYEVLMPLAMNGPSQTAGDANLVASFEAVLTYLNRFSEKNPLFKFLMLRCEGAYSARESLPSTSTYSPN